MFYVYINYAKTFDKYYIGQSNDFSKRLAQHNNGLVKSTKPYLPWKNVCLVKKDTRAEAMSLENKKP
ncbi:GIY-YIG nuclease family protein [Putridiphycobacter roseus]|uniref:GIY-YIG nuclease family protein n=1 Tax=Putridiphycobacter roseus TaxID=2219161 RepID=A0A2W1N2X6_9FLAO|nr:GIY-YIG nuclease family protein [Putridiphycobacter roseus]PZE18667.1 GIY-YIG nuclease family protein [Putridiphycobacter roseus]